MTSEPPEPSSYRVGRIWSFLCGAVLGYCIFSIQRRPRGRERDFHAREAGNGEGTWDLAWSEPSTLFVLDASLNVRRAFPAVREILGYSPEWLTGRGILGYLHPGDVENFTRERGRKPIVNFRMRHAGGSWCSLQASWVSSAAEPGAGAYRVYPSEAAQETPRRAPVAPAIGLVSRESFMERLELALSHTTRQARYRESTTLIVSRIDNFDAVDASLGRTVGDQLLSTAGLRLRAKLRPEDTLSRTGRGEFAVLLENDPGAGAAIRVAERITESLNMPILMDGRTVYVTVSAGIASGEASQEAWDEGGLMSAAVSAVEDARENGTRYEIFKGHTPESELERLKLESDLRWAIERGELTLHYQPQVILGTGEVAGVEALLRWEYPRRGTVPPKEFISFIEATGLVVPIGIWALREACRSAVLWRGRAGGRRAFVSVNLSARQFQQPDLAGEVSDVIQETGIDPGDLVLEITETLMLDNTPQVAETLRKLRSLGIKLALDDFGTGYSSLSYLERIPVDYLKIDQSFISRLHGNRQDSTVLLSAILSAAETLGIGAIAEGLETEAQLETLKELRCEMGQGYYYSEPLPLEEVSRLIGSTLPSSDSSEAMKDPD